MSFFCVPHLLNSSYSPTRDSVSVLIYFYLKRSISNTFLWTVQCIAQVKVAEKRLINSAEVYTQLTLFMYAFSRGPQALFWHMHLHRLVLSLHSKMSRPRVCRIWSLIHLKQHCRYNLSCIRSQAQLCRVDNFSWTCPIGLVFSDGYSSERF